MHQIYNLPDWPHLTFKHKNIGIVVGEVRKQYEHFSTLLFKQDKIIDQLSIEAISTEAWHSMHSDACFPSVRKIAAELLNKDMDFHCEIHKQQKCPKANQDIAFVRMLIDAQTGGELTKERLFQWYIGKFVKIFRKIHL